MTDLVKKKKTTQEKLENKTLPKLKKINIVVLYATGQHRNSKENTEIRK